MSNVAVYNVVLMVSTDNILFDGVFYLRLRHPCERVVIA